MRTQTFATNPRRLVASLSLLALVALGGCEAVQPKPRCRARPSKYAAKYTLRSVPTDACKGKVLTGEILSLGTYRVKPGDPGNPSIAIEPVSVSDALSDGKEADVDFEAEPEYSLGPFSSYQPDDDDVCTAPELEETSVKVAAIPAKPADPVAMTDARAAKPAVALTYKWRNLRMLVTPLSNALHFGAFLSRTEGDCKANYRVSAVYPVVRCGDGVKANGEHDPKTGDPDDSICEGAESGLSTELEYECEPSTRTCVPKSDFPSYKPFAPPAK